MIHIHTHKNDTVLTHSPYYHTQHTTYTTHTTHTHTVLGASTRLTTSYSTLSQTRTLSPWNLIPTKWMLFNGFHKNSFKPCSTTRIYCFRHGSVSLFKSGSWVHKVGGPTGRNAWRQTTSTISQTFIALIHQRSISVVLERLDPCLSEYTFFKKKDTKSITPVY